jgi:DNA-directed RNA polymerase sigma subunit (sigma70/sigma32)
LRVRIESPFVDDRRALHFEALPEYPERRLSGRETSVLLQAIEAGSVAARKLATTDVDEIGRRDMQQLVERGQHAKESLAAAYLWDAAWYTRCVGRNRRRLEAEDLMQDALIGLLWAIETFDPESGSPFESHASHRMQWAVRRSIAEQVFV